MRLLGFGEAGEECTTMPLSPQVHRDDESGNQQPGFAILAFVSVAEKNRFLHQFNHLPIRDDYVHITMYGRRLKCRTCHSNSAADIIHGVKSDISTFWKKHYGEGYVAPEMQHDTTTPNGKPDLTDPFSMKNGVAYPGGVYYDAWGNLCGTHSPSKNRVGDPGEVNYDAWGNLHGTHSPSIPTARAPTSGVISR